MAATRRWAPAVALLLAGLAMPVPPAGAQGASGGRMGYGFGQRSTPEPVHFLFLPPVIQRRIRLTPQQESKVAALRQRVQSGFREAWKSTGRGANQAELLRKMKETALQADRDAVEVLTVPQRQHLVQLQAEAAAYEGLGRYNVALLAVDNLSPDQKRRLKSLAAGFRARRVGLARKGSAPAPGSTPPLQALNGQAEAAVRKLLTPVQVKQAEPALAPTPPGGR